MSFRGHTRSTWQQGHQEDTEVSELSSDNLSSRSPSVETVVEVDDEATDQLSLKLNRLTEKLYRYESHKYFITKCLKDKLIPEGFYSLEPSIGNHNNEFLQEWYEDLNNFLLTRMEKQFSFVTKLSQQPSRILTRSKRISGRKLHHLTSKKRRSEEK